MKRIGLTCDDLVEIAKKRCRIGGEGCGGEPACGMAIVEQTGFTKIFNIRTPRKAVYIAHAKGPVARINAAGFDPPRHRAIVQIDKLEARRRRLGTVRGQIRAGMDGVSESDMLEAFGLLLEALCDDRRGFGAVRKESMAAALEMPQRGA